tara:strand:+ start:3962 stop:4297 length:336 start_codon:yes stop_codon:yes gene_type:complete
MVNTIERADAGTTESREFKTSETTRLRERRKNAKSCQVRIPRELKDRIDALRDEFEESAGAGRMDLPDHVCENSTERLPIWFVIEKALNELEDHRARSRKTRKNSKTTKDD